MARNRRKPASDAVGSRHEEIWLLGQPPLADYLDFVEEMVISDQPLSRAELVDEWRVANDHYRDLEESEEGIADSVEIRKLPARLEPLADAVRADPRFLRSFDSLPTEFAMVELDRLIIGHPYVSRHHTSRIAEALGPKPSAEALFRFCLPLDRVEAPVSISKTGPRSYILRSPSSDFRFQEIAMLNAEQLSGYEPMGAVGGVVAAMVGFGSNFLNVIESGGRMLLHNGHHRAVALRELGITHAPIIVQHVTRLEELRLVAARAVLDDPAFYFKAKRPPLLKDFLDPRIRKILIVHNMANVVEVTFEIKEMKKIKSFEEDR